MKDRSEFNCWEIYRAGNFETPFHLLSGSTFQKESTLKTTIALTAFVITLIATPVSAQNQPPIDRYFAEFDIGYLSTVRASGFDGGVGGITAFQTGDEPKRAKIVAKAIVKVEEAQNFTWEWVGVEVEDASFTLEGFPNVTFDINNGHERLGVLWDCG